VGHYGICYCSQQHAPNGLCNERSAFNQRAGDLYVRGTEYVVNVACQQGEPCSITLKGKQFSLSDEVLLFSQDQECTDWSGDSPYPSWTVPRSPATIEDDLLAPGITSAQFTIPSIQEPGTYNICYCSHIAAVGAVPCIDGAGNPELGRFGHTAATVTVAGTIGGVKAITHVGVVTSPLPSAPFAASVEVDALIVGIRITCAVTKQAAPGSMVPTRSDLLNCTKPVVELSSLQQQMPRCLGLSTTPEQVSSVGWNLVHVPLTVDDVSAISELHVWCFASEHCENDKCVVPASSSGRELPMTAGFGNLLPQQWSATPVTPFDLRVRVKDDFQIGLAWPRVKIIAGDHECHLEQLYPQVTGIGCENNALGKCAPAPESDVQHTTSRELIWPSVTVPSPGLFEVCYCDRHYELLCAEWLHIGRLTVSGPTSARSARYKSSPQVPFDVEVNGLGLSPSNRLRLVPDNLLCTSEVTSSTQFLDAGAPSLVNATFERWSVSLNDLGRYKVCWCGGSTTSCSHAAHFTVRLGFAEISTRQDCELTDWWEVDTCNRPCGGGTIAMRREIKLDAQGGGAACPPDSGLVTTQECNMEPCPLARLDFALTEPTIVRAGSPFVVHIEGDWLANAEDRILLISSEFQCGASQVHAGGAACANDFGTKQHIICGDGVLSMRVALEGQYRICFCDATSSIVHSADGSRNISTGSYSAAGLGSMGCSDAQTYLLSPAAGAIIEVLSPDAVLASNEPAGVSKAAIIAMSGGGAALLVFLLVCLSYTWWRRKEKRRFQKLMDNTSSKSSQDQDFLAAPGESNVSPMALEDVAPPGGMDMQMIAWYEAYYQSLGYPPGTATNALAGGQQQLALPPSGTGQDIQESWLALQNAPQPPAAAPMLLPGSNMSAPPPPPLALPGPNHFSDATRPPTPPTPGNGRISGQSPRNGTRASTFNKTFSDLIAEAQKKTMGAAHANQVKSFTDMDLSPMPTPSATPRGDPTPRAAIETPATAASLAIEDGRPMSRGELRPLTGESSRPVTGESNLSIGSSAPGRTDQATGRNDLRQAATASSPHGKTSSKSPRGAADRGPDTARSAQSDDRASLALSDSSLGESTYSPVRSRPQTGESSLAQSQSRPNTGESPVIGKAGDTSHRPEPSGPNQTAPAPRLTQSALRVHDSQAVTESQAAASPLSPVKEELPEIAADQIPNPEADTTPRGEVSGRTPRSVRSVLGGKLKDLLSDRKEGSPPQATSSSRGEVQPRVERSEPAASSAQGAEPTVIISKPEEAAASLPQDLRRGEPPPPPPAQSPSMEELIAAPEEDTRGTSAGDMLAAPEPSARDTPKSVELPAPETLLAVPLDSALSGNLHKSVEQPAVQPIPEVPPEVAPSEPGTASQLVVAAAPEAAASEPEPPDSSKQQAAHHGTEKADEHEEKEEDDDDARLGATSKRPFRPKSAKPLSSAWGDRPATLDCFSNPFRSERKVPEQDPEEDTPAPAGTPETPTFSQQQAQPQDCPAAAAVPVTPTFSLGSLSRDFKETTPSRSTTPTTTPRSTSLRNFGAGLRERLMTAQNKPPPPSEPADSADKPAPESAGEGPPPPPPEVAKPAALAETESFPGSPADRHMPPTLRDLLAKPSSPTEHGDSEATPSNNGARPPPPPPPAVAPPPPSGQPPQSGGTAPGPDFSVDTPGGSASGTPDGGRRAPSLGALLQSQERQHFVPPSDDGSAESPQSGLASAAGGEEKLPPPPPPPPNVAPEIASGTPPPLPGARPVRAPGPMLDSDSDQFEDTRGSTQSLLSQTDSSGGGSPQGGRRKITLGGLAHSSQAAAQSQLKVGSPKAGLRAGSSGALGSGARHQKPPKPKAISGTTPTWSDKRGDGDAPPAPPPMPPPASPISSNPLRRSQ
jgi:hypothetical protein